MRAFLDAACKGCSAFELGMIVECFKLEFMPYLELLRKKDGDICMECNPRGYCGNAEGEEVRP